MVTSIPFFRKKILSIVFLFSMQAWSYPFFYYNPKEINITDETFRRYIRTQSRNISNDFYFLLKTIHPLLGPIVQVKKNVHKIEKTWLQWETNCKNIDHPTCKSSIKKIYSTLKETERTLLFIKSKYTQHLKTHTDPLLKLLPHINHIALLNYRLIHVLEEIQSTSDTSFELYSIARTRFFKHMHPMKISSQMMITSLINEKYRNVFEFAYIQFISPLETQIVEKSNKKYLLENLESLNLAWNTFHMKISKSENRPPKNITNLIKIMHNRWNSILKIILRK